MGNEIERSISDIWKEIESWYQVNSPRLFSYLAPGTSDQTIEKLERLINLSLPDDYKASLKCHNGGSLINNYMYYSVSEVMEKWKTLKKQLERHAFPEWDSQGEDRIKNQWWHPGWIPVADHLSGALICIDLAPGARGQLGQIIEFDYREGPALTDFASFADWMIFFRDRLTIGYYKINQNGYLEPAE
jgi:cell wall assembly regulator SMI1